MTRAMITVTSLRQMLADTLPILEATLPSLNGVQLVVTDGNIYATATDRYIAIVERLGVSDMSDKRRLKAFLSAPQLRMLGAWLRHVGPRRGSVLVSITDSNVRVDPDGDNPLILPIARDEFPDVVALVDEHWQASRFAPDRQRPHLFSPGLVSHIKDAEVTAVGGEMEPLLLRTRDERLVGMVMPMRPSSAGELTVSAVREAYSDLLPTEKP